MLYDDAEQLEVRHVIALEYHDVSIHGGPERIPEGELWIKRNAICLSRNTSDGFTDQKISLPFFFFSENCSEKEDFYFALLKNQEKIASSKETPPLPQEYEVKDIITLVQKLHSSEEHLQTRWLNALMGRLFLSMYKTPELEAFIRNRMTKKISRVKKPNFITKLVLQKIDMGEGAPFITNPRLKDLTVNGDCTAEADLKYSGRFRIEIAATARIDLGTRFKTREVELVLAVVVNKLEGHGLLRFKPPPSNRVWVAFEAMPNLDLKIEPIVSSRHITYNIVLRAIESRIREVVAETLVLPFWDDIPFLDTRDEPFRGGVWKRDVKPAQPVEIKEEIAEDEAEAGEIDADGSIHLLKNRDDRTMSEPNLPPSPTNELKSRTGRSTKKPGEDLGQSTSISLDKRHRPEPPRALRSSSFATVADPMVSPNHADANGSRRSSDAAQGKAAAQAMLKELSSKSVDSRAGSPPDESALATALKESNRRSSKSSEENLSTLHRGQGSESSSMRSIANSVTTATPTVSNTDSNSTSLSDGPTRSSNTWNSVKSIGSSAEKRQAINLSSATNAAKSWGWGVLARNQQREKEAAATNNSKTKPPGVPMGRGRPLPPPGTPLPHPERSLLSAIPMPKRKAVPPLAAPPTHPTHDDTTDPTDPTDPTGRSAERRSRHTPPHRDDQPDEVLVVEAPVDDSSNPSTPEHGDPHGEFFGPVEDDNADANAGGSGSSETPPMDLDRPKLPPRTGSSTSSR